jgi:nicotinate-nucleotide pyrophosphorylase (carboxylating)
MGMIFPAFLLHSSKKLLHGCVMEVLKVEEIQRAVREALSEDIGAGDVTTLSTVPLEAVNQALMVARAPLVVSGMAFAEAAFFELDPKARIDRFVADGAHLSAGQTILRVQGKTHALLSAERVALNFVQRLSGVATATARYVELVKGTKARILDTRKTTPGWRRFEKYAVVCGGGQNHRIGLYDMILIKDNHLAALAGAKPNPVAAAVGRARAQYPKLQVEVEADTLEQVRQAVEAGADIILMDNMSPEKLREAVRLVGGRAKTEASGGVNATTCRDIAETGVDYISIGAITHSAVAVDVALDFE